MGFDNKKAHHPLLKQKQMQRYIIIEDERFAYEELKRMMQKLRPNYCLAGWAQSINEAVELVSRGGYDFIITDIRLADGLCFDVFERQPTNIPVIFTTAYDEYALKAFSLNSIDYLLKPVEEDDLSDALDKLEHNFLVRTGSPRFAEMAQTYISHTQKNRFLIRIGDTYRYVLTADTAFFYSKDKTSCLCTLAGKCHIIDYPLDYIEPLLDRDMFFRISRNCIANIKTVGRVSRYFGGRLKIKFTVDCPVETTVSRSRTEAFLKWMGDDER